MCEAYPLCDFHIKELVQYERSYQQKKKVPNHTQQRLKTEKKNHPQRQAAIGTMTTSIGTLMCDHEHRRHQPPLCIVIVSRDGAALRIHTICNDAECNGVMVVMMPK